MRHIRGAYGKKFEASVLDGIKGAECEYKFEGARLPYVIHAAYYPDVVLPNGVMVEIKTYLGLEDEVKMKAVRLSHPDADIRFLFEKPQKKMPGRQMTHGEWAIKYGFKWGATAEDIVEWSKEAV